MKILVENYNNIEKLDYELYDGKINFLFGISWSGKSSLVIASSKFCLLIVSPRIVYNFIYYNHSSF